MIEQENLIEVGRITKPHGLRGEMIVSISDSVFTDVKSCPYLVCAMDGIFVPFFVADYRMRNNGTMLLRFDDVDSQEAAAQFSGHTLWFDRRCFTAEESAEYDAYADNDDIVGYTVSDAIHGTLGTIVAIDDQTANVLFVVERPDGTQMLLPAADDLIDDVDDGESVVRMHLPEGLIDESLMEIDG